MKVDRYLDLQTEYNLKEYELDCILLNFVVKNQAIAFNATVAKEKGYKSAQQASNYFFNKIEVKKFIHKEKHNITKDLIKEIDVRTVQDSSKNIVTEKVTKKQFAIPGESQELTRENIKQVLESELSKITEPEKRTALLIRITDLLSLQNNNSNELERPVIYLPGEGQAVAP
jgi:hypothetical protein